jgi:hypothetical protein
MVQEVHSTLDILNKNKKCLFCDSNLILMSELALTKISPTFSINNNHLIFKTDPNYFLYARIDLNTDEFQIEKNQNPALFINYRSIHFYRKCVYCNFDFTIKYSKYKFKENVGSTKLDTVEFKFINNETQSIYLVSNNYFDNLSKVKFLSYESNYYLQLKSEHKFDFKLDFNYNNINSIKDKLESIVVFS